MSDTYDAREAYETIVRAMALLAECAEWAKQDGDKLRRIARSKSMDAQTREMFRRKATERATFDMNVQTLLRTTEQLFAGGLHEIVTFMCADRADGAIEGQDQPVNEPWVVRTVLLDDRAQHFVNSDHSVSPERRTA